MNYEVLNPLAEFDYSGLRGISPRVGDLDGKLIGLFSYFKPQGRMIIDEVEKGLKSRFPSARFSHYSFPLHGFEIVSTDEYRETFEKWVKSVDTVITGHSD